VNRRRRLARALVVRSFGFSLRLAAAGISEHRRLRGAPPLNAREPPGFPAAQALRSDVLRRAARVAEHCDAPRRVALPAVMSIKSYASRRRPHMVQSRGDFKTALLQ